MKKIRNRPKVWLVGAGPGDPGLMTVSAREKIRRADRVYHDALVSPEILKLIPEHKRVPVGKRAGGAKIPQPDINRVLVRAARTKNVIRLKGGDPFIFGRGGEEADALRREGISVGVVPGVTSGLAAVVGAGIPLTDRRYVSSLTLMTAVPASSSAESVRKRRPPQNLRALVRLGGTWVWFMGLGMLSDIARRLTGAGASPRLPVAVVSHATTPRQRVVTGTLADINGKAKEYGIEAPAIIVVGRVVSLRPSPLVSKHVLVLRPAHQSVRLTRILSKQGARVTECPILAIQYIDPNPALASTITRPDVYDWVILTSANAAGVTRPLLAHPEFRGKIAAVGPGTAAKIRAMGLRPAMVPPGAYTASVLADAFVRKVSGCRRVLFPCAADARDELAGVLRRHGHRVDVVPVYRTITVRRNYPTVRRWVRQTDSGLVPLTSASMARAFAEATKNMDIGHLRLVSIGPVTSEAARDAGLWISAQSPRAEISSLTETLGTVA